MTTQMITTTKTRSINSSLARASERDILKKTLIKMAESGKDKPSKKTKLGVAFRCFISPNSECYDKSFVKKIKTTKPGWLLISTKEKNRQTQIKVIFKLIEILCRGQWFTSTQLSSELSKNGYPRCHRTIKRLLKVLRNVNFNLLCKNDEVPFKYKAGRKPFLKV